MNATTSSRDQAQVRCEQLLRALVIEVRGLRQALQRTGAIVTNSDLQALLAGARALFGDDEWTSGALIDRAHRDAGPGSAMVRQALADLQLADPMYLGFYLKRHAGRKAGGLELRRVGLKNKVARWCVIPA